MASTLGLVDAATDPSVADGRDTCARPGFGAPVLAAVDDVARRL